MAHHEKRGVREATKRILGRARIYYAWVLSMRGNAQGSVGYRKYAEDLNWESWKTYGDRLKREDFEKKWEINY